MEEFVLTDAQWAKMQPHCLGRDGAPGRSGADNRRFVEAVLWVARAGRRWQDLPSVFGKWKTVYTRYRYWVKADVFWRVFEAASKDPDMKYAIVDATLVELHLHDNAKKTGLKIRPPARLKRS